MSAPDPKWIIRPYLPGDERALVALFERVFGRPVSEAHWLWKHQSLPSPVANEWLACDGDEPIFHYSAIPARYALPSGETTAMVSVDTMTAPEYRRRGLLTRVGQSVYDTWRQAGIPFVIGLVNDQWGSRATALGWQEIFRLHWMIRPLRPQTLLARRTRVSALERIRALESAWNLLLDSRVATDRVLRIRQLERAGPELDRLWLHCAGDARISIVRDSAWVHWRFLASPSLRYQVLLAERAGEPVGYVAYRVERAGSRTVGYVAELLAPRDDPQAARTLIRQAVQQLRAASAELAATLALPESWLYQAFRRAGFLWSWGSFGVHIVPLDAALPLDVMRDPSNWMMSGADYDSI